MHLLGTSNKSSRELEAVLQPVKTTPVRLVAYERHADPTLLARIRLLAACLGEAGRAVFGGAL